MLIRKYKSADVSEMARLFYETVHAINIRDYTQEQLNQWASGGIDLEKWSESFLEHLTYVAIENNIIVGFGDIDKSGYLDRLFVHKEFQGRGIATAICDKLEKLTGAERVIVHASITAKPFFEKRGYRIIRRQKVERKGVFLINYLMEKLL